MASASKGKTVLERFWVSFIAKLPCLVCSRYVPTGERVEAHHVAEGSGERSWFGVVPLCSEHHRGKSGFHGWGEGPFCAAYRVPGEREWGLLVWLLEDIACWVKVRLGWRL